MAKLFRHSPLNSIWEGSGNVICLDVLRAHKLIPTFVAEIKQCSGIDSNVDSYIMHMEKFLYASCRDSNVMSSETQYAARHIVDQLAVAYQASLLLRYGCPKIAEMYIQSRIHPGSRNLTANYGSVPFSRSNIQHVLQENYPVFD